MGEIGGRESADEMRMDEDGSEQASAFTRSECGASIREQERAGGRRPSVFSPRPSEDVPSRPPRPPRLRARSVCAGRARSCG